jgi:hypothetical protein
MNKRTGAHGMDSVAVIQLISQAMRSKTEPGRLLRKKGCGKKTSERVRHHINEPTGAHGMEWIQAMGEDSEIKSRKETSEEKKTDGGGRTMYW